MNKFDKKKLRLSHFPLQAFTRGTTHFPKCGEICCIGRMTSHTTYVCHLIFDSWCYILHHPKRITFSVVLLANRIVYCRHLQYNTTKAQHCVYKMLYRQSSPEAARNVSAIRCVSFPYVFRVYAKIKDNEWMNAFMKSNGKSERGI